MILDSTTLDEDFVESLDKNTLFASLFRELPEILTPIQIARAIHQSKNLVYEKLKEKELAGYLVHGRYLIAKADLIEYIIEHGDEERLGRFGTASHEQWHLFFSRQRCSHPRRVPTDAAYQQAQIRRSTEKGILPCNSTGRGTCSSTYSGRT